MLKRGRAYCLQVLWAGYFLELFLAILSTYLSHNILFLYGWRILFFLGGVLGFIGIYIRKRVSETPVFRELLIDKQQLRMPLKELFKNDKLHTLTAFFLVIIMATCVMNFFLYLMPHLVKFLHYPLMDSFTYNSIGLAIAVFFIAYTGIFCDKYDIKELLVVKISSIIFIVSAIPGYYLISFHNYTYLLAVYVVFGISFGLYVGSFSSFILKHLKPAYRYSGYAVSYNIALAVTGFIPAANILLINSTNCIEAPAFLIVIAGVLGLITSRFYKTSNN